MNTPLFNLRLDPRLQRDIKRHAEKQGVSASELVRELIEREFGLEAQKTTGITPPRTA